MFPEVLEIKTIENQVFFTLASGVVGTAFTLDLVDAELSNLEAAESTFTQLLRNLPTHYTMRFVYKANFDSAPFAVSRDEAFSTLGYSKNTLVVTLESKVDELSTLLKLFRKNETSPIELFHQEFSSLLNQSTFESEQLKLTPLTEDQTKILLDYAPCGTLYKAPAGLDTGSEINGIIRLRSLPSNALNFLTFASLKDTLPVPYEITVSINKISSQKAEYILRTKTNQTAVQTDSVGASKHQESQEKLEQVALQGASLLNFEYVIRVPRQNEKELRKDSDYIIQTLKPYGDFYFETIGAYKTYISSRVGGALHVPIMEMDSTLPSYLPVVSYGDSASKKTIKEHSLALHRLDESPMFFNQFDDGNDNYSVIVVGASGRGKSVFVNLQTRALMNDPNIHIIKVDVGGSHSKETEALGGKEFVLSLDQPSGINPFFALASSQAEDVISMLTSFLTTLILEEGETKLSKEIKGDLEAALKAYADTKPQQPSIDGFLELKIEIPRRKLLERWTSKGVFANAFKVNKDTKDLFNYRLKYYNFSQIFQAADPDFGQGGFAAVMAQFYIELMMAQKKGKRIVFMADETPIFIERGFEFFKFATANVRKFGGGFIPIVQKSSDLVVNGDDGIIFNCATQILLSVDGDPDTYGKRLKLEPQIVDKIQNLQSQKGKFSDVMIVDKKGPRIARITLTPEEYWSFTSSQADNHKLKLLMDRIPGITRQEAMRCLSLLPSLF